MITRQHIHSAIAGAAVTLALVGGGYAAKQLVTSDASTAFSQLQGSGSTNVPYLGPFAHNKKGVAQCGPAVRIMEGALRRTTPPIRKTKAANCVGAATTNQIKTLQRRHKIVPSGIYGLRTHKALSHAYSRQQTLDLIYLQRRHRDALRRSTILIVTAHAFQQQGLMGYCNDGQLRHCSRRGEWPAWPDVPRHTDCSGYVSWVLFQSGVPNPNGVGVGNTGSLILHGARIPINGPLKIGDLIFYGYNNSHVAIYIGHGLVSSHGQPGINIHPYGYRPIYGIRRYF